MRSLFFFSEQVGYDVARWLLENYKEDIALAVVPSKDDICYGLLRNEIETHIYTVQKKLYDILIEKNEPLFCAFVLWFGAIIKDPLLSLPQHGFISMHPAYLPYTRGANFNIWPIVEESPFGVSLFQLNDIGCGIDSGDIVARKKIPYTWLDNGETLRVKAKTALVSLFAEAYPDIRLGHIHPEPQDMSIGTTHYKNELEAASRIDLNASYTARHLLNWLRARTYPTYPACYFFDNGKKYEVRVAITEVAEENK